MVRVLFVCLGNICRSPMAEAVFRHKVNEAGLGEKIEVDSAGTGDWHVGNPPHEGTQQILTKEKISFKGMTARQVQSLDFEDFDYIIAMDEQNIQDLHQIKRGNPTSFVDRLLSFVSNHEEEDVPDPYFTGNFEHVFQLVEEGCEQLLQFIREREQL
ncbi:low molecular weight protein-tyrosine-phosphatase [Bacillus tianshenii]|nr:low molecular weight protein-tyrosine-phosphatase [Bacillus tianshenii]